jgi:hypothetical protein
MDETKKCGSGECQRDADGYVRVSPHIHPDEQLWLCYDHAGVVRHMIRNIAQFELFSGELTNRACGLPD